MQRYKSFRGRRSTRYPRAKRNYRYITAFNTNRQNLNPNGVVSIQMISPAIMASVGMTGKTTIASVQGYLRWDVSGVFPPVVSGASIANARCAMGMYVDTDGYDPNSVRLPYQDSQSTQWMIWRADSLASVLYYNGTNIAAASADYGSNGRRLTFMTRKYKRTLDGAGDSLVMVIQNSAQSTNLISYDYYFRILVLE